MSKQRPPAPTASAVGPCPTLFQISRTPRHWILTRIGWLVGCFGFNGPLRQYFSLYRSVSQREGERGERIEESKNVQTTPTRTYCKRNRPLPYFYQIVGRPGTGSLPSTIAPPDHPLLRRKNLERIMRKSVHSKRKCFTEKDSWQGIHRGQSIPFSKKECVINVIPILSRAKVTSSYDLFYNLVAIHQVKA